MTVAEEEFQRGKGDGLEKDDADSGVELEKKAEEEKDVRTRAELYHAAAIRYQLAKSWIKAATTLRKSADCYREIGIKKDAARLFLNAGMTSLKIGDEEAVCCFNQAVEQLIEGRQIGRAASYCEHIGKLYRSSGQYDRSLYFYKRCADLDECTHEESLIRRSKYEVRRATRILKREDYDEQLGSSACCCSLL